MTTFIWEIAAICLVTSIWAAIYLRHRSQKTPFAVGEDPMMQAIANHTLLQHYFNNGDEISEVQILEAVYTTDRGGALVQTLCRRVADGNTTIRLYFVNISGNQHAPYLLAESTRALNWGNRLAFYEELRPLEIVIYSGCWVEALYQQLALTDFDGVTMNWITEERRVKFALKQKMPSEIPTISVIPENN